MNRILILIVVIMTISIFAHGQEGKCPKLPEVYAWNNASDYDKDFDLVRKTLKWLCNTPLGIDVQQRSLANAFVMEWLAGCPQMRIEVETDKLNFYGKYPDMLFSFIHGAALYRMEKKSTTDSLMFYIAGYTTVATLAGQSEELAKTAEFKPMIRALKKNKMKAYTEEAIGMAKKR